MFLDNSILMESEDINDNKKEAILKNKSLNKLKNTRILVSKIERLLKIASKRKLTDSERTTVISLCEKLHKTDPEAAKKLADTLEETPNNPLDITGLVTESYENLLEFQETIYELDMKMIKCEHSCIVNENTEMLILAEEEYKNNVSAAIKAIGNKIILMIQKAIIAINNAIAKFKKRFKFSSSLQSDIKRVIEKLSEKNEYTKYTSAEINRVNKNKIDDLNQLKKAIRLNINVLNNPSGFEGKLKEAIITLKGFKDSEEKFDMSKAREVLEDLKKYGSDTEITKEHIKIDGNLVINAYNMIETYGPEWIRILNDTKREADTKFRQVFTDSKSTANATYFQRIVNSMIIAIQKIITGCFKICFAVNRLTYNIDFDKKHEDDNTKREQEKKEKAAKSEVDYKEAIETLNKHEAELEEYFKNDETEKINSIEDMLTKYKFALLFGNNNLISKHSSDLIRRIDIILNKISDRRISNIGKNFDKIRKDQDFIDQLIDILNS